MKRTTYILIGLFVAGLCVLVGGMFMIFCLGTTEAGFRQPKFCKLKRCS